MKLASALSRMFFICVASLFLAAEASGQQNRPKPPLPSTSPLPATFDSPDAWASDQMPDPAKGLISLDVSVSDKTGKSVSGLSEKDFTLLDNDRQQKIVTFKAFDGATVQPANSLEIVLVIDELNFQPRPEHGNSLISDLNHNVENFLRANGGLLARPTMIYRLTEDGLFAMPHATMDGNELAQALEQPVRQRRIWSPSMISSDLRTTVKVKGATHDKVAMAMRAARETDNSLIALGSIAIEERQTPGRKLMFWLGNGWPSENGNAPGLSDFSIELLTRMCEARITLWSALEAYDASGIAAPAGEADGELAADSQRELANDFERELAKDLNRPLVEGPRTDSTDLRYISLPVIAIRSGGGILDPGHDLATRISECVREAGAYYLLTFDPPRTNVVDEYHHLKIEVDQPGLTGHVLEDYYDEPVFYDQIPATQSVSVKQLQALIASAHDVSDAKLAHELSSVRLTERLSGATLESLEKSVRGKKARGALEILADKSAFFDPPDDQIIAAPPPEVMAQQQMISKVVAYIESTIPHLPDLLATRTSVQFEELPSNENQTWKTAPADQSLHEVEITKAGIRFRQGKELVQEESVKRMRETQERAENEETLSFALSPPSQGTRTGGRSSSNLDRMRGRQHLNTVGAFGPILGTITVALTWTRSQLNWDHWEQGNNGSLAVFRYHVTQGTPFFTAGFCCLPVDHQSIPFIEHVPFHGRIAVDPATGAIMRLTVQSDLGWRLPLERSDLMVEYSPVAAGSKTFICPSRSVSISRQRGIMTIHEWGEAFEVYAPFETVLNEMEFDNYHVFGSTSRILPGYIDVPQQK